MTPDQIIIDNILTHQLDLLRLDASLRNSALDLLSNLELELQIKLATKTMTELGRAATKSLLKEIETTINDYYLQINGVADEALVEVGTMQQAVVSTALQAGGYGSLITTTHFKTVLSDILITGAPSKEWWARQAGDTSFRFSNVVRQGIVQGETNPQITRKVMDVMQTSRHNAEALVRTSVQTVANESRLASFKANSDIIKGVRQLSTFDSRTTEICVAYSGGEWDLDGKPMGNTGLPFNGGPPRHWNCRSVLVPITRTFKELGINLPEFVGGPGTRASIDGPVRGDMTFDQFLKTKPEAFQNEMLGKAKADLWRQGKITLPQLLDMKGNPLTVTQLKARL